MQIYMHEYACSGGADDGAPLPCLHTRLVALGHGQPEGRSVVGVVRVSEVCRFGAISDAERDHVQRQCQALGFAEMHDI